MYVGAHTVHVSGPLVSTFLAQVRRGARPHTQCCQVQHMPMGDRVTAGARNDGLDMDRHAGQKGREARQQSTADTVAAIKKEALQM